MKGKLQELVAKSVLMITVVFLTTIIAVPNNFFRSKDRNNNQSEAAPRASETSRLDNPCRRRLSSGPGTGQSSHRAYQAPLAKLKILGFRSEGLGLFGLGLLGILGFRV